MARVAEASPSAVQPINALRSLMPAAISKSMVMSMLMCVVATCVRMVMAAVFMPVRKMFAYVLRLFHRQIRMGDSRRKGTTPAYHCS